MAAGDLPAQTLAFIREHGLLKVGDRVLIGVSGGVDSVVLLHVLREAFDATVAHVHHGLRPDADDDASFVESLASAWRLECHVLHVEVPAGDSRQAQARRARYRALDRLAVELGITTVAVAHHRDDVAETLLLQLFRGAGPRGWRAMPVTRPIRRGSDVRLVRPLRFASRAAIEAYARSHQLNWREDPSNTALGYRRSAVRGEIIPLIERHFGSGVKGRLADAAELAEAYLASGAALAPAKALRRAEVEPGALSVAVLLDLPGVVRRGVILEVLARTFPNAPRSADAVRRIERLLEAQPGRRVELGDVAVWREQDVLRLTHAHRPVSFVAAVSIPGEVQTPWGELSVRPSTRPTEFTPDPNVEYVDADRLGGRLVLRTWGEGDRFKPVGMEGSKKVSDLLTEQAVPSSQRHRQLVLVGGEELVWVVGHRLSRRVGVTGQTARVIELRWHPTD